MAKDLISETLNSPFRGGTLDEWMQVAQIVADSDFAPKDYKGKPGNVLVALQLGAEVGLGPMQSIQGIAVVSGRPVLYGDSLIALVRRSPLCEYVVEHIDKVDDGKTLRAVCRAKRRNHPEIIRTFSDKDAERADLTKKGGTWTQYRARMLQMRARSWALRDLFPDVLKGLSSAEELEDVNESGINVVDGEVLTGGVIIDAEPAPKPSEQLTREALTSAPEEIGSQTRTAAQGDR